MTVSTSATRPAAPVLTASPSTTIKSVTFHLLFTLTFTFLLASGSLCYCFSSGQSISSCFSFAASCSCPCCVVALYLRINETSYHITFSLSFLTAYVSLCYGFSSGQSNFFFILSFLLLVHLCLVLLSTFLRTPKLLIFDGFFLIFLLFVFVILLIRCMCM